MVLAAGRIAAHGPRDQVMGKLGAAAKQEASK
jgi:hypothetical protein